jgi:hypothetical protein
MQKITDYVLRCAGVEVSAEVLPFERADRPGGMRYMEGSGLRLL